MTAAIATLASGSTSVDATQFRDGMARLAAAVNIIATMGTSGPYGFTASAVCSVTDSPPTLLVCVNRASQSYPALMMSGILAVNTLSATQEALASRFAGGVKDMNERFAGTAWSRSVTGSPILEGASVAFDCRIADSRQVGTHAVLVCEVLAVVLGNGSVDSLVYFDRRFRSI